MKRKDKPIRYEVHARRRMAQRGIDEDQVVQTTKNPDQRGPARRSGAEKLTKKFSKTRRLIVIVEEEPTCIWVVTAYKG